LLALAGCSATQTAQINADAQTLFPPTAENLGPSCAAPSPSSIQQAACDMYEVNVAMCNANLAAAANLFEGAAMICPGYGPAIAAAVGAIQPVISAAQLWWCAQTGYIQHAPPPAPAKS
jgi:hypothetical protein